MKLKLGLFQPVSRATLFAAWAAAFLVTADPVAAQADKAFRIGTLRDAFSDYQLYYTLPGHLEGFGYRKGNNVEFENRSVISSNEELGPLAKELVALPVDLIIAEGAAALRAASDATGTIPIVALVESDPGQAGDTDGLQFPHRNATGVVAHFPDLASQHLDLLKETVPKLHQVCVLWNGANPESRAKWNSMRQTAERLDLTLGSLELRTMDDELAPLINAASETRCEALQVLHDRTIFQAGAAKIPDLVKEQRLPSIYSTEWYGRYGGLMSYGPSEFDINQSIAGQVDRILKGASPSEVDVERPTLELHLNTSAATEIGVSIPPTVLQRAARVME